MRDTGHRGPVPELPDVEVFRRHLARTALHRRIADVEVHDATVVRGTSISELGRRLRGAALGSTRRHGKHLFVETGEDALELHFGMTGLVRSRPEGEEAHRHTRVSLRFDDGGHLDFVDQRKLGTVAVVDDVDARISDAGLGPDVWDLVTGGPPRRLGDRLDASAAGLVAALMDQSVVAGLGNIYSDEILFHARLDPGLPAAGLSRQGLARLHRQTGRVLERTVRGHAQPGELPRGWLIHAREDGAPCPRGRGLVRPYRAAGRNAYWCPECQGGRH